MSVRSDLVLGLRLALAGGRQALARLLLIASGIALGVGLLLSVVGIFPAEAAVERRAAARQFEVLDGGETPPPDHLLLDYAGTTFGERPIAITYLAPVGRPPKPPWLDAFPRPNEIVVSPDLAELLASPDGALLRPRLPAEVVDVLDERWLVHPGELVAYAGAVPAEFSADREIATGYGLDPARHGGAVTSGLAIDRPLSQISFLVSVGLLIPIAVFVVTGARLSASARESRLAAIRLVGGTPAQARLVTAGESLLAGSLGCALGIALFLAGRPLLAAAAPPGNRWFPSDLAPPPALFVAILVGVLVLSVGASLVSLRRVVVTPLGVVRGGGRRVRGTWRWAMLGTGLGGLLTVMLAKKGIIGNNRIVVPFLVVSYGLTALGAAAAAPVAGSAIARVLAKVTAGPGIMLGARRLQVDPRTAGRTVGGIVIVVIAAAITTIYVGVYQANYADAYFPASVEASTVIVEPLSAERIPFEGIADVEGVDAVAPAWLGYTRHGYNVLIADCQALDAAVVEDVPSCVDGVGYVNGSLYDDGASLRPEMRLRLDRAPRIRVEVTVADTDRFDTVLGQFHNILVSPGSASPDLSRRIAPSMIYVDTDGDPATVERIRNALAGSEDVNVYPRGTAEDYTDEVPVLVDAAVTLGIAIAFAIAAATLLVTAVDAVGERRRSLAMLVAVGTSRSVLRRALAVETALPMLAGVALGLASAIGGTWMVFEAVAVLEGGDPPPVYWRSLGYVVVFAIVATVVATIATFPSLGRAIRPESLRTE
ncbi:MAG TPA: FtsX-like permease family protein [Actinomycetota bacterium]|nr:FtsX-like permease family protein [Actinomycetota bacterium]